MARKPLDGILQHIRKMAAVQTYRELSDRELLERFIGARDETAFTVLVDRHGPMVHGVCRRALPNFHDAEDACQATFLVLARTAASVRKKASLSSWLHGVARRVAASLKRDHTRRKARERGVDGPVLKDPAAEVTWREAQAILDEELQRLPERYRAPLILCHLECMTRDEAAKQLGLSLTTLHGRVERARNLLRATLTRRGLTLGAVMSAAALGEGVSQATLAPTFVVSSTKAAILLAAGRPLTEGVVATHVLALTQEVLKTMFLAKLKFGTATLLCACLAMAMIGGSFTSLGVAQDAPQKAVYSGSPIVKDGPPKPESDAEFIRRISKDLRGNEPTPAEIHFFLTSTDAGRRQKLIDLFIEERQTKKALTTVLGNASEPVRKNSVNNLKQIGLAMHNFYDRENSFPAHAIFSKDGKTPLLSWRVAILPYIDQQNLYDEFKFDEPWDSKHNKKLISKMPDLYEIPGAAKVKAGETFYQVITGPNTVFNGSKKMKLTDIIDGTSNTILVVEAKTPVAWSKPEDVPLPKDKDKRLPVGGVFTKGFNVLLCDGSVRFLPDTIEIPTFRAHVTPAAGD